jgi:alcohol dehydrogenase
MQLGAFFAGLAIETSMLGATHALANPLSAEYDIVHGQAIGLMLPHVIRYNGVAFGHWYGELADSLNGKSGFPQTADRGPAGLADYITSLVETADLPTRLSACGVEQVKLPTLAAEAAKQWTGAFNPRPLAPDDFLRLYEQAF